MAKGKKVLIIDDDERLLKAYDIKLSKAGHTVVTESNGTQALDTVTKEVPDLIVLDVLLPHKTGWEILEEIKADAALSDIPVVMVSNIGSNEKEIEAAEAGAAAYLVKSNTSLEELVDKVESLLDQDFSE